MRIMRKLVKLCFKRVIDTLARLSTERFCFSGELGSHNGNLGGTSR
jgi:hypothetical protein